MIVRALLIFAGVAGVSALAAFFASNPGTVTIDWANYRLDTSVGVLLTAVAVFAVLVAVVYQIWRRFRGASKGLRNARERRRTRQGYLAVARGLVAVSAGDADEAKRQAKRASGLLDEPALTRLLSAQAAQLDGDEAAARRYFTSLLEGKETEFLGVRGLLTLAEQDGDRGKALELARKAEAMRPGAPWVLDKLFLLEVEAGQWAAAEQTNRESIKRKTVSAEIGRRRGAIVMLERSRQAESENDGATAIRFARKALDDEPQLAAAAIALARLHKAEGDERKARKVIEDAWKREPHPLLAGLYRDMNADEDAIKRLKAMSRLEKLSPDHRATRLAMARAALDAKLWGEARRYLDAAVADRPSTEVYRIMAALVEAENDDADTARTLLARAGEAPPEPGWVCGRCGAQADEWAAVCANCGAFDTIAWTSPPRVTALALGEAEAAAGELIDATRRQPPMHEDVEVLPAVRTAPPVPDVMPERREDGEPQTDEPDASEADKRQAMR